MVIKYIVESDKPLLAVHAYFNKNRFATNNTAVGEFLFTPGELGVEDGEKTIEIVAYDQSGSRNRDTVRISIEKP